MKKNITEEESKEIVKKNISEEQKNNLRLLKKRQESMTRAEELLVVTFDERQIELYRKFCRRRNAFYESADKIYNRMYDEQ